jgi:FAD/FMN-containing dehydrogenase
LYDALVARLREQYDALPADAPVRLGKRTSNLFRTRAATTAPRLDVSGFSGVLTVDTEARTADVLGMTTYEDLVDAVLPYGLMPLVVPQLKTITLGGAVSGVGIESSSFRNGTPHESVVEMDILTGDGRVVTCSKTENPDLFYGFPNSYGTLGYALRLRIELEPVKPYVALRHVRCGSTTEAVDVMREACLNRAADFVDGTWFTPTEVYVTLGSWSDAATTVSDYTGMDIYYRSIQSKQTDTLTVRDYLWRWDTDWFWCSRAFGAQNPTLRRLWPRRYRRSSFYWKLVSYDRRFNIADRIDTRSIRSPGRPLQEPVVQDIEVPIGRTQEFLEWFLANIPIEPVWLCPLRLRDADGWPLYPIRPGHTYVNVGFWSSVPAGGTEGETNRLIEGKVSELEGHKSLYSDAYYSPEEFDELYGGEAYKTLKKAYDPDSRFLDLYAKAVQRR